MASSNHHYLVETGQPVDQAILHRADSLISKRLPAYRKDDGNALFELGCACSTGSRGAMCDLIEAHKWFNLAAAKGHAEAHHCRADVAEEMTAREIVEAQRRARAFLGETAARRPFAGRQLVSPDLVSPELVSPELASRLVASRPSA